MAWGLDGLQLSNKVRAAYIDETQGLVSIIFRIFGGSFAAFLNNAIDRAGISPYYDFYLTRDNPYSSITPRDYSGLAFNKEIATTLLTTYPTNDAAKLNYSLNELEKSAFAYCYNKNKRDANGNVCVVNEDGTVNTDSLKWYLPAIDEIEEIAMGAYDEFNRVFQNEKYWSCQPSAENNTIYMVTSKDPWLKEEGTGTYKSDDLDRARATSVFTTDGENYSNIGSGATGNFNQLRMDGSKYNANSWEFDVNPLNETITFDSGNLTRDSKCRIRAVYRSGTGTKAQ